MRAGFFHRPTLLLLLTAAAVFGCDEESSPPADADVVYQGGATDEALDALLAKTVQDVPAEAAQLTWPVDGDKLPKDDPLSFWFEIAGEEATNTGSTPQTRHASTHPVNRRARSIGVDFGLGEVAPLLLPFPWSIPKEARAHGTPISGRAYYLVASTKSNPALLRVFTTGLDYEPDASALKILHGADAPITVVVTNAIFEENRVVEDGGPFKGIPITIEFVD